MTPFHFADLPIVGRVARNADPENCPHCGRAVQAIDGDWTIQQRTGTGSLLQVVYTCPRSECGRMFLATFALVQSQDSSEGRLRTRWGFSVTKTDPPHIPVVIFPPNVKQISPLFCEIYSQASEAEHHKLLQICGLGYRKAVEYLIKDFCVSQYKEHEDEIKGMPLGSCISKFVSDTNVKTCAERAVWLGNDEAHYVRKFVSRDISDMKVLIRLTSNWIDNLLLTAQFQTEMQRGGDVS